MKVDVRLIAATNLVLEEEVEKGNFREDLFYRLNVVKIRLPALRERREDIPRLIDHFIKEFSARLSREIKGISLPALELCTRCDWPGNVRELRNAVERSIVFARTEYLEPEDFGNLLLSEPENRLDPVREALSGEPILPERRLLARYAERVLEQCDGNKKKTCSILGIDFKTLQKRLGKGA